jgi:hypothetical protein
MEHSTEPQNPQVHAIATQSAREELLNRSDRTGAIMS